MERSTMKNCSLLELSVQPSETDDSVVDVTCRSEGAAGASPVVAVTTFE